MEIGRGQTRPNQWESWVLKRSFPGTKYYFQEKIWICEKVWNKFLFSGPPPPFIFYGRSTWLLWEHSSSIVSKQQRSLIAEIHRQEETKISPFINTSLVSFVFETNRSFNLKRRSQINILRSCSHANQAISIAFYYTCTREQFNLLKREPQEFIYQVRDDDSKMKERVVKLVLLFCVDLCPAQIIC